MGRQAETCRGFAEAWGRKKLQGSPQWRGRRGPLRSRWHVGSTGQPTQAPAQSTNVRSQQLGIIGTFDDDRTLWVSSATSPHHAINSIILPRKTLTNYKSRYAHTSTSSSRGRNALEAAHLAPDRQARMPTLHKAPPPHPSPIEPQISPDSANARLFWEKKPSPQGKSTADAGGILPQKDHRIRDTGRG